MDRARAFAVLFLQFLLVLLGTPGLDYLQPGDLRAPGQQAELRKRIGEPGTTFAVGVAWFNREIRLPIVAVFEPLQPPFRVSQLWTLYRDGPGVLRRLEVRVDGTLRFRSADPDHPWLADVLRNRHVRPVVESSCVDADAPNWEGLTRLIADRARDAFPDTKEVELRCVAGRFPGDEMHTHHAFVSRAPDWTPARVSVDTAGAP